MLASQTSLPVHNTFPAIHNLIYVTIAPINNSVGQLRNYSLKGPANLVLPVPRSLCLAVPGGPTCWAGGGVAPSAPIVCPTHGCPPAFATRQHLPALHPPISSPAPPQHPRSSTLVCMHTAATDEARAKIRPCSANPPAKCDFPLLQFPVAHIKALMRAQDQAASESPAPWPPAPCIHHQGFGDGHASPRGPQHPASPFLSAQPRGAAPAASPGTVLELTCPQATRAPQPLREESVWDQFQHFGFSRSYLSLRASSLAHRARRSTCTGALPNKPPHIPNIQTWCCLQGTITFLKCLQSSAA